MVALLAVWPLSALLAQRTAATISGEVRDPSGAGIPAAEIAATRIDTGGVRSTSTDANGSYLLADLQVGAYSVRASAPGFQVVIRENVVLTVAANARVDFELPIGEPRYEITITEPTPLVETLSPELAYLVGERSIEELPINGRNVHDLMLLQPGVQAFRLRDSGGSIVAHGLGVSVNGQDPRSNVYLLDGTLQNDFTNGPAGSGASTSLGMETIREFRVEANLYSAEFGRNFGGQVNALTKSGGNNFHGSAFEYLRNDNLDARNFFDPARIPEFRRNQFGGTLGGPIAKDKTFFFVGYEGLREDLGRTINSFTPDADARRGVLPAGAVPVDPAVQPYLDEYPLPNGPLFGDGTGLYTFGFNQELGQDFLQGRVDHNFSERDSLFVRYTIDDAEQRLPTGFPQFPRAFLSRNQFLTLEERRILSTRRINTFRASFSRTRIGQDVEANTSQPLDAFIAGLPSMGQIDIGGLPRLGPQTSNDVQLTQNVFSFQDDLSWLAGKHMLKLGGMFERYQDNLFNPTFSRGIFFFANLQGFLQNQPLRYIGLTPGSQVDRYWRFNLAGVYVQDDYKATRNLTLNLGLRYEYATVPNELRGRNTALLSLTDPEPTFDTLYGNPTTKNFAPRVGFAWDVLGDGQMALRGGYGLFYNTNNQQNLIVTVVNPPSASRPVIGQPTFPHPVFRAEDRSIRPIEYRVHTPYLQTWNLNLQRQLPWDTLFTAGYAGSRGIHLMRNTDANTRIPTQLADGRWQYSADSPFVNPSFSTIELKKSDGRSWYNALVVELRKRFGAGVQLQGSYTFSRSIDTTQASTFFSDSRTGTTSAMPELPGFEYNKGLSDFHAKHNLVWNFLWDLPFAKESRGLTRALLAGWQAAGIVSVQSGNPLTAMVQRNRSLSGWAPTVGAGRGVDRPALAPGFTHESAVTGEPEAWFRREAFALQPEGFLGPLGRNTFVGPNLRTVDFSLAKSFVIADTATLQLRAEAFNLFNRANFGPPAILAFAGTRDGEAPLGSFGRITSTVTSSRQIQFGLRLGF